MDRSAHQSPENAKHHKLSNALREKYKRKHDTNYGNDNYKRDSDPSERDVKSVASQTVVVVSPKVLWLPSPQER